VEEIRRLVVASGLPNFRYYSFPAMPFASMQATPPEPTPLSVIEPTVAEAQTAAMLWRPDIVLITAGAVSAHSQATTARYPLLAEIVEAMLNLQPAIPLSGPAAAERNAAQALSWPTRRRPRTAGRAAMAAIGQM